MSLQKNDRVRKAMWWNESAKIKKYAYGHVEEVLSDTFKIRWDQGGFSILPATSLEFVTHDTSGNHPTTSPTQA